MNFSRKVCVFCGSRSGHDPAHATLARALGAGLVREGIGLVYGGGRIGLMGVVADAVLDAGGHAIGVIPDFLMRHEIPHRSLSRLEVVGTMHQRKQRMVELSDAFLTLPGGFGTFDETVEIITWRQLGLHDKPVLIVNGGGWARALVGLFETAIAQGFAHPSTRGLFEVVDGADGALARLRALPSFSTPAAGA